MKTELMKISEIKINPKNPRIIKDEKFHILVNSVKKFPEMLELRPIVIDENNMILGGNQRLKACKQAGLTQVPTKRAEDLTEEQKSEFIIKDNASYGEWDWEVLEKEWNKQDLEKWAVDVWEDPAEVDYNLLESDELDNQLDKMSLGSKKAIQIEFSLEDYEEAYSLIKFFREKDIYVGNLLIEKLKQEKLKL